MKQWLFYKGMSSAAYVSRGCYIEAIGVKMKNVAPHVHGYVDKMPNWHYHGTRVLHRPVQRCTAAVLYSAVMWNV
jgi:hypothetical protein